MKNLCRLRQRLLGLAFVAASALVCGCGADGRSEGGEPSPTAPFGAERTGLRYLSSGAGDAAFARADRPRPFVFPEDHGAHDAYRSEWWYFTGNLETAEGRHFGFELTFFRFALDAVASGRASDWGTNQAWMAHFALTDTQTGQFVAAERFARGALGLAGAVAEPFTVWVEGWAADARQVELAARGGDRFAARLEARDGDYSLDLELVAIKEPVPNGEDGLDRKGSGAGNASYYYSISRLEATGTISTPQGRYAVQGSAWLDREWGTSALEDGAVGWDWFALQLDDGRDLMFYRLRRADGARRALTVEDVRLEPTAAWTSPASGVRYPVAWRLAIPSEGIELVITPVIENQELDLTVRYWEGAVRARGTARGGALTGRGYLELAGY
jgi:predicted secreted hydrolase